MNTRVEKDENSTKYNVVMSSIVEKTRNIMSLFDREISTTVISKGNLERELDKSVGSLLNDIDLVLGNSGNRNNLELDEDGICVIKMLKQALLFYQSSQKLDYSIALISEKNRRTQERAILSGKISAITLLEVNVDLVLSKFDNIKEQELAQFNF